MLSADHPVADMGKAGNRFALSGEAVWQLFGRLVRCGLDLSRLGPHEAKWYPPLAADGRADTPLWMRELRVWAQTGGAPSNASPGEAVHQVPRCAGRLSTGTTGTRSRSTTTIPITFPTKPGFADGVASLQASGRVRHALH